VISAASGIGPGKQRACVGVTDSLVPEVARIVVLGANGLGDLVVAQPALAALRAAYPDATITLVTSRRWRRCWRDARRRSTRC
jgi:hypothetical protein